MKRSQVYRKAAEILDAGVAVIPEYALLLLNRSGDDLRDHGEQSDDIAPFTADGDRHGLSRECPERADAVIGLLLLSAIAADEERHGQA